MQHFDLNTAITMFTTFTIEIIVACILLIRHKLAFRFKPYISIPCGLLMACSGGAAMIIFLTQFFDVQKWNEAWNIFVYTIPTVTIFIGFFFAYKISVPKLLLTLSVAYTFQHMAYQWVTIVLDTGLQGKLINSLGFEWYQNYYQIISYIVTYTIKVAVYVGCYFIIARTYIKYSKYIFKTLNVIILGIMMYLVCNVANAYVVHHMWWDGTMRLILALTLIMFCILFDTLIVGGFHIVERREETTIIKATLNSKIRQQEMMENNINFINMKCHDLRKELRRLKDKKGSLTDEDFYLLEESLNFYDSSVKTGNVNIDALLQDKLIYCNSVGIEFTSLVDGDAFKDMTPSDVYFLLTNIIDNAIEATESIEEKENRIISLTASKKQGVLVIEETNYFNGHVEFNDDGTIKTTKKDNKKYHGYGTKSIAYITRKYDGKMDIDIKDNIFKLKIAI